MSQYKTVDQSLKSVKIVNLFRKYSLIGDLIVKNGINITNNHKSSDHLTPYLVSKLYFV